MFDAVIHLKPAYCVKAYQQVDICEGTFLPHYRDYEASVDQKSFPIVDFDPVACYVRDLRQAYGELALFFYDTYGSTRVYVLWRPEATTGGRELKISNVKYRLIDRVNMQLELNVEAILDDFKLIGSELVDSITIKKESSIFKQ